MELNNINIYDLDEEKAREIVTEVVNNYLYEYNNDETKMKISTEVDYALKSYIVRENRDAKINRLFDFEIG